MKKFFFWILLILLLTETVRAQGYEACSFNGSVNFSTQEVDLNFVLLSQGSLRAFFQKKSDGRTYFLIETNHFPILIFEVTEKIDGYVQIVQDSLSQEFFIEGATDSSSDSTSFVNLYGMPSGTFEIRDDKFYLKSLKWRGFSGSGQLSLKFPYDIDLSLDLQEVLFEDFLLWMGADQNLFAKGNVSGNIDIAGFADQLFVSGELSSFAGQVDNFYYDHIEARFRGIYPILELTRANVAEQDGVNVRVEGTIDLSKDFSNFNEQIFRLRTVPLIRSSDISREWTIRRQGTGGRESETGLQYRLRRSKETSGVEESDLFGIQHRIKF